jgi:hypothetical protein
VRDPCACQSSVSATRSKIIFIGQLTVNNQLSSGNVELIHFLVQEYANLFPDKDNIYICRYICTPRPDSIWGSPGFLLVLNYGWFRGSPTVTA